MSAATTLAWTGARFEPVAEPAGEAAEQILAADSWLVVDHRAVAVELHALRFADAVAGAGGSRADALAAVRESARHIPDGAWSPRVDLTDDGIRLRVRPASPREPFVEVDTVDADPRTQPRVKGPDLDALGALRDGESARLGRPVEPVLAPDGIVAEAVYSAVLWWRDDALHVPADDIPRLDSVTGRVLERLAEHDGIEVRRARSTPADLEGCEVWLANALRGVRGVTRWHDGPPLAEPTRAGEWHTRLTALRAPLPALSRGSGA